MFCHGITSNQKENTQNGVSLGDEACLPTSQGRCGGRGNGRGKGGISGSGAVTRYSIRIIVDVYNNHNANNSQQQSQRQHTHYNRSDNSSLLPSSQLATLSLQLA